MATVANITLTTDFGLVDHYVGTMKGVIASICPEARVIDISHGVPAYALGDGAFVIAQAWRYFPPGTVHVVVVDPGVGSSRRPILLHADGQFFVAPDNGVLSLVMSSAQEQSVRWINATEYFLPEVSQTFHGRDIFAAVGAHLAAGVDAVKLGPVIDDAVRLPMHQPQQTENGWRGAIIYVDKFGNLITNIKAPLSSGAFTLVAGEHTISTYARSYSETAPGELFVIGGSSGFLEISTAQASAALLLGIGAGALIELYFSGPEKA